MGAGTLSGEVKRVNSLFRFALDSGLIDQPVRFGPHFRGPSRRVMRFERAKRGPRMFEAMELRAFMDAAQHAAKSDGIVGRSTAALATPTWPACPPRPST